MLLTDVTCPYQQLRLQLGQVQQHANKPEILTSSFLFQSACTFLWLFPSNCAMHIFHLAFRSIYGVWMASKVLSMWEQDVSSTELLYMVMNLLLSKNMEKQGFSLHSVEDHEIRNQNLVNVVQTKRNQASMSTLLCRYTIQKILKKGLKVCLIMNILLDVLYNDFSSKHK